MLRERNIRYILDDRNHRDIIGVPGVGEWRPFAVDPGWVSTLRYRVVPGGVQFDGTAQGALPANALGRIGVLGGDIRPLRQSHASAIIRVGLTFGWGLIELRTTGELYTQWSIGGEGGFASIGAVMALD